MNNFRNLMRRTRLFTKTIEDNLRRRAKELEPYEDAKGSKLYDNAVESIDQDIQAKRKNITEEARKDLSIIIQDMRKNAASQTIQAPTPEMVTSLQILGMLETITPTQLRLYADMMASSLIAMSRLQQIAKEHNLQIIASDPDALMKAVDTLENNLAMYLANFNGNEAHCSFGVRNLYRFFQPEEVYMKIPNVGSVENADKLFWKEIVGYGSPDLFDSSTSNKTAPSVQYFFGTVDGLSDYISKATSGLQGSVAEEKVNEIFANCPEQYSSAYQLYKSTGEKMTLNEDSN